MEEQEAREVISVLVEADNGCPVCARDLFFRFITLWPEFAELAKTAYEKKFEEPLNLWENKDGK